MPVYTKRTPMPVSAQDLYLWHTRPGAFERLSPPWAAARVVERSGTFDNLEVTVDAQTPIGVRRIKARHVAHIAGERFVDEQVEGPFARWVHTHRFIPDGDTSFLEDSVTWELPFGGFGSFVAAPALERMFAWRHARTAMDLDAHARWSKRPLAVALSGARGLVGEDLIPFLTSGGHSVRRLVRGKAGPADIAWDPAAGALDADALAGIDAFVHLSGEPISTRWTPAKKEEFRRSRVDSTRLVATTLARMPHPPRRFICASATGYYGDRGAAPVTESSGPGEGFLPELCAEWEAATQPARDAGIEVVNLRLGVVLAAQGGALPELARPFRMGVGGTVGSGDQYFSWITLADLSRMMLWLLATDATGAVNATAPHPVTNRELTRALGAALGRPTLFPVPAAAIRLAFGEMGERLILEGANVLPAVATAAGFPFLHPEIAAGLKWELG